jgi:hypothetical protein
MGYKVNKILFPNGIHNRGKFYKTHMCSTVVKCSTCNPTIKGSNPATVIRKEKKRKCIFSKPLSETTTKRCQLEQFIVINDNVKRFARDFISNGKKGKESKTAERQGECVRGREKENIKINFSHGRTIVLCTLWVIRQECWTREALIKGEGSVPWI